MFKDNRVFVVMSPQVKLTIAADTVNAKAGTILANGPTITADLAARVADKGYARAEARFAYSTAKATVAQSSMTSVSAEVLAQTPVRLAGQRPRLRRGEIPDPAWTGRPRPRLGRPARSSSAGSPRTRPRRTLRAARRPATVSGRRAAQSSSVDRSG